MRKAAPGDLDLEVMIASRFIPTPLPPPEERRGIRDRAGVSLLEAGRIIGCHHTSIIGWERGKEPSLALRRSYWQFLDACQRGVIRELTTAA